jgi:uncharacterized protein
MITVELEFEQTAERSALRPAHRERLGRLHAEGLLRTAGPWSDDSGALLLFDCDAGRVARILAEDPYYRAPGVRVRAVREWSPIVG